MPAERVPMRQAREIIRLKLSAGVATREIARRLGLAPSTVRETLSRVSSAGLSWPLREGLSDAELEAALYANRRSKRGHRLHAEPDWPAVHRELKRKHVTLLIVWDEYIAANPSGTATRAFANSIAALDRSCRRRCGRRTRRGSGCSWITREMGFPS
jgi:transposase